MKSMRPFEILLALLLFGYIITTFHKPRALLAYLAGLAAILQIVIEGYRWQMVPLYALTVILVLTGILWRKKWAVAVPVVTLILLAVATALPILLPIPSIPPATGSYPVGTTTITLTDPARQEIYSGKEEPRRFQVQIWYPADPQPGDKHAPWMNRADILAPALARYLKLPSFFLDHLTLLKTPAYLDSPLAKSDKKYPVIVFSHGWSGFAAQNTGQAIELASHGYVVVGMQHTYGAIVTVFPDGTIAPNNPAALPEGVSDEEYLVAARRLVGQWAGDISFALDYVAQQNADSSSAFYSALDLDLIGVYGHSTGGGAAIQFCGTDARCKAVLGMDPFMTPVSAQVLDGGVSQPAFFMFSEVWHSNAESKNNLLFNRFFPHVTQSKGVVFVTGTRHYDFSDMPMLSPIAPQLGLKGPINGGEMSKIANAYLLQFFDLALRGKPSGLFNGPVPQFPEVKFFTPPAP
jgi:predicted dienelactone hydrolase